MVEPRDASPDAIGEVRNLVDDMARRDAEPEAGLVDKVKKDEVEVRGEAFWRREVEGDDVEKRNPNKAFWKGKE